MRVLLGELVTIVSGFAFASELFNDQKGIPVARIRDVIRGRSKTFYDGSFEDTYVLSDGDLLVGMDGEFNSAIWQGGKAVLNQRVCKLIPDTRKLNFNFLKHILPKKLKEIEARTSFVTVKHLSLKEIRAIQVDLPALEEQKRIAAILDKADSLRRKRQQAILLADDFLRAVFLDMFGDPATNPKSWPVGIIRDFVASASYGTSEKADKSTGQYPILRINNLTYEGRLDLRSLKYVDLGEKTAEKYLARPGDLLFNRTNSKELVGKTAIYDRKDVMAIAGYLVRVRFNDRGNPYFVSAYLNSVHGKATLRAMCKSIVGMANINAQEMQDIPIMVPPASLQGKYAEIVKKTRMMESAYSVADVEAGNLFASLSQKFVS